MKGGLAADQLLELVLAGDVARVAVGGQDVPIYTGARLTAGAAFAANGQTTWGMEWETLDTVDKVQAFYAGKLSQGDWTVQIGGVVSGAFSATFSRKSNSKFGGILGADETSGVTKISLSFVSA